MKGTRLMQDFTSNKGNILKLFITAAFLVFILSCASVPEPEKPAEPAASQPVPPAPEPVPEAPAPDKFEVSEDLYKKTFSDIEALINNLNRIIKSNNFDEWKKYLTKDYIEYYSSQENLKNLSETPILKKYKIVLRSLKDYFTYVVVPSRADVQLDDISFIDDNNIKAYMKIDGEPVVLYTLINIQGNWKIGL
jgi:hypothetical protein